MGGRVLASTDRPQWLGFVFSPGQPSALCGHSLGGPGSKARVCQYSAIYEGVVAGFADLRAGEWGAPVGRA